MTYYANQRLSTANTLTHHGVKGMKWGVRKRFTDSVNALSNRYKSRYTNYDAYKKSVKKKNQASNKEIRKAAGAALGATAVGTLGSYGVLRALGTSHNTAKTFAGAYAKGGLKGTAAMTGAAYVGLRALNKYGSKRKYMKKYKK